MKKNAITKELSLRAKFKSSNVVEVCIMNMVTNEVIVQQITFQFGDTEDGSDTGNEEVVDNTTECLADKEDIDNE